MEDEVNLSVVLPSYLEEENLRLLLPRLNEALHKIKDRFEVIVIDTMRPLDQTPDVCQMHRAKYVNREKGDSFGDAVRTGIRVARGEYILFMDADGSHPPEFIETLHPYIGEYDVIIASRYIAGGYTENNRLLIFMSRVLNKIYSLVLNLDCRDVSNSFKVYRADQLKALQLYSDNFDIIEEILFKLGKSHKRLSLKEVPFTFKKRMCGQTKRNLFLFMLSYLFTLLKLRFGK